MKKLSLLASAALIAMSVSVQAQAAGTIGQAFTVSATLVTVCQSNNTTPTAVDFGAYTSFGSATVTAPTTTISFKCTKGVVPLTAALNSSTGTIKGLNYSLAMGAISTAVGAAGAADVHSYVVTGTMAASQVGDTAGAAGPITHTLTITY